VFLFFQTVFSLAIAVIVSAILDNISGFDPKYLNLLTVSSFWPLIMMSVLMPLVYYFKNI